MSEEEIRKATIGSPKKLKGPIELLDYDPRWPKAFENEQKRIAEALGDQALRIEHVGSTSVPRLAAKPIIDILLVVPDSSHETSYVPPLENQGYVLRIREPEWHEHRMFKGPETEVNLHVFSEGCSEIDRMLMFRDWLRRDDSDRNLYEQAKRSLAHKGWKYMQNYADAKSTVVEQILARARGETR